MFWWIIISAPFLLLLLALCLPITLTLNVSSDHDLVALGQARWAFWRIRQMRFALSEAVAKLSTVSPAAPPSYSRAKPKDEPSKPTAPAGPQLTAEPQPKARKQDRMRVSWATARPLLQKYLPRCWRALHVRCLHGRFRLAVNDPACYGWIFALTGATQLPRPPITLQVELNQELAFQADVKWHSRSYPIQWLWLLINFGLEPPVRAIWWSKLRKKGESKRARSQSVHRPTGKPHFQQDSNRRSYLSG